MHILSDRAPTCREEQPRRRSAPPPVPVRQPARELAAQAHAVLRTGAQPTKGLGGSTILFLVLIALVVLTMSVVGLALLVPTSQWALLQG